MKWIVKYRYGGTQDFFDPDIVAYTPGLSRRSIEAYRKAISETDLGKYGRGFAYHLLDTGRADEAWAFAVEHLDADSDPDLWHTLCRARALTNRADTLPVYRRLVTSTLRVTDVRNYHSAAKLLVEMGKVAAAVGIDAEHDYREFVQETAEANRRRRRCIEIFRKSKLLT